MLMLNEMNKVLDTNTISQQCNYWVLRMKDVKNPDFFCESIADQIEVFSSASVSLNIGPFEIVMPLHWSVLCSDLEYVQTIPLYELNGQDYSVFCVNPLDSYMPEYLPLRQRTIFPNTTWSCPPMEDKDMLVVPLGYAERQNKSIKAVERGPVCAIFSPNKIDISRPISDIW